MNRVLVDKLARALLYEGYILYPYRPSVKNRRRWTFGGIYPPAWSKAQDGSEACAMQTQCLLEGDAIASLRITVRFLHLADRTIGRLTPPVDNLEGDRDPAFELMQSIQVHGNEYHAWQEAVEREVDLADISVGELLGKTREMPFAFPYSRTREPLRSPGNTIIAMIFRQQEAIEGAVELSAAPVAENLYRITVRIVNHTPLPDGQNRDGALMRSFASTHTILETQNGKFVSLTDPPAVWRAHALACANIGAWPVMVGAPGETSAMLSSPIIIEDYPRIAPESPGDLFDAGEIDEILTLRIMTLTDEEKRLAAGVDERVRDMLARTDALARDQLRNLHGTLRQVARGMKTGDRVRLHPLGRGDVMDIALDGRTATIAAIEQDLENRVYVAVTIDDDPGKDLGLQGQPGHRFFFGIDEVEPLEPAEREGAAI